MPTPDIKEWLAEYFPPFFNAANLEDPLYKKQIEIFEKIGAGTHKLAWQHTRRGSFLALVPITPETMPTERGIWYDLTEVGIPEGEEVLMFSETFKHADFNLDGIILGTYFSGVFVGARWNDCYEAYDSDVTIEPTHWMHKPEPPSS